ncbi:MAG: hypothetical protein QOG55_1700 [Acidobacteriaceae bacterium]|jgi:hypothetical protein|nr:hypothetical protein [Acidobacteriaceae bacterium]
MKLDALHRMILDELLVESRVSALSEERKNIGTGGKSKTQVHNSNTHSGAPGHVHNSTAHMGHPLRPERVATGS